MIPPAPPLFDHGLLLALVVPFAELKALVRSYWWLGIIAVPILLFGYHFRGRIGAVGRLAWLLATGGLVAAVLLVAAVIVAHNYHQPPQWDFQLYWVYGRAAQLGQNPYDVEGLRRIAATIPISAELEQETFFLQSPPTLFLFAPLGWFDIRTACLLWEMFHAAVLAVVIVWQSRLFPDREAPNQEASARGAWLWLLLVAALSLSLRSTLETFVFTQVNFLLLALLLGCWQYRNRTLGGVLLGLALIVKPVVFPLPIYLLVRRHFAAFGGLLVTGVASCLLTILVFGPRMFFDYFFKSNPLSLKVPDYFYTEWINQSLLATTHRLTHFDLTTHGPYANPLFWVLAAVCTAITGWVVCRLPRNEDDWALAASLLLSLLLFPKTLSHYGVLLLPPILLIWTSRQRLPGGVWGAVVVLGLAYVLLGAHQAFLAIMVVWLATLWYGQCLGCASERSPTASTGLPQPHKANTVPR